MYLIFKRFFLYLEIITKKARPWLFVVFTMVLAFVVYQILIKYKEISSYIAELSFSTVLIAIISAVAVSFIRAFYRLSLYRLAGLDRLQLPAGLAIRSYAWGQLMRYVPGKIMGPATEVSMLGSHIKGSNLLRITAFEMVAMFFLSVFWLIASWLWLINTQVSAIFVFVVALFLLFLMHVRRVYLIPGSDKKKTLQFKKYALMCILWLVLEWCFFYVVWMVVVGENWFSLATAYAAASLVGTAVFVAPAGLGVREASYTFLAPLLAGDIAGGFLAHALIARVLFSFADVIFPLILLIKIGKNKI